MLFRNSELYTDNDRCFVVIAQNVKLVSRFAFMALYLTNAPNEYLEGAQLSPKLFCGVLWLNIDMISSTLKFSPLQEYGTQKSIENYVIEIICSMAGVENDSVRARVVG